MDVVGRGRGGWGVGADVPYPMIRSLSVSEPVSLGCDLYKRFSVLFHFFPLRGDRKVREYQS